MHAFVVAHVKANGVHLRVLVRYSQGSLRAIERVRVPKSVLVQEQTSWLALLDVGFGPGAAHVAQLESIPSPVIWMAGIGLCLRLKNRRIAEARHCLEGGVLSH